MLTKIQARTKPTKLRSTKSLEREIVRLRSFIVSLAGEDAEGNYQPEFVDEIMRASAEKPTHTFTNPKAFLKLLTSV